MCTTELNVTAHEYAAGMLFHGQLYTLYKYPNKIVSIRGIY